MAADLWTVQLRSAYFDCDVDGDDDGEDDGDGNGDDHCGDYAAADDDVDDVVDGGDDEVGLGWQESPQAVVVLSFAKKTIIGLAIFLIS